jgi:hypothetical protein
MASEAAYGKRSSLWQVKQPVASEAACGKRGSLWQAKQPVASEIIKENYDTSMLFPFSSTL